MGKKYEYVNFAHTVNLLRSNMKKIYNNSEKLQSLNTASDYKSNCNVQVLPITWRHSISFQTDAKEENIENPDLPTLSQVTVNGVLPLRKLLADGLLSRYFVICRTILPRYDSTTGNLSIEQNISDF